ncbi:DUF3515 domain-containing protein [Streptomyces avermitilis]|uniref:DUF3515 domain-containing protein n=1 Tax=Streptomyces avermitilis TaxID=33903 RepID=UPI0033C49517
MNPRRRLAAYGVPGALAVVLLLAAAAYLRPGGDEVAAEVPAVDAKTGRICRALAHDLPDTVAGLKRRTTDPSSPLTAAWGDPAIVLRCGVPRPAEMNSAGAVGADLKGVGWMLGSRVVDGRHLCTTTLREIYVEVSVPTRYGDVFALEDLAAAVRKNVPDISGQS